MARQYREVAVTSVGFPLSAERLEGHFLGREVYKRTRYVVVRRGPETALVEVSAPPGNQVMSVVTGVAVLALPDECAFTVAPDVDTAVPSSLALAARRDAPGKRGVVVEGRYHHINFILDPSPARVRVVDVVPPTPPKLLDQAARVLAMAEDLPPIELVADVVDLANLARDHPAGRYLLPCRGSGFTAGPAPGIAAAEMAGARTAGPLPRTAGAKVAGPAAATPGVATPEVVFLDERPPRQEWTLIGCARSRELHRWFYGDLPETVDMCPRQLAASSASGEAVTLTKCCLLEDRIDDTGDTVVVPWGASLDQVRQGLAASARRAASREPTWSPG